MTIQPLLTRLDELEKYATKGELYDDGFRVYALAKYSDPISRHILFEYKQLDELNHKDYLFIAELRNAYPTLRAEIERLQEVERKYNELTK